VSASAASGGTAHGPRILLIEDNQDDIELLQRAFRKGGLRNPLEVATDGDAAISALQQDEAAEPCLILLDLKLPRRSGFEVLEWIRANPATRRLPVVVLTSSRQSVDIARAYDLGANSYLVKPVASNAVLEMVQTLNLYWCLLNEAAPRDAGAPAP
jgi:CheY-like chemotaxis protein